MEVGLPLKLIRKGALDVEISYNCVRCVACRVWCWPSDALGPRKGTCHRGPCMCDLLVLLVRKADLAPYRRPDRQIEKITQRLFTNAIR